MIKRILPLALGLLFLLSFVGLEKVSKAVTASYTSTMRFINSGGFVIDGGTASATTASYNATAQIVNSSGTVIDPGTASTAVASPNITLRVVDSTGHVIDAFATPAPTPSPVATPVINTTVSHGAPAAASTTVAVPAGTAAGDRLFLVTDSQGHCSSTTLPAWTNMTEMVNSGNSADAVTTGWQYNIVGGNFGAFTKVATAADASSGTYLIANCGTTLFHYVMVDVTRADGITPGIDRLLQGANNSSANQTGFSVTTNRANEVVLTILDHIADNKQCSSTNNTNLFNGGATESLAASYTTVATLGSSSTAATFTCGTAQQAVMWTIGFF